MAPPVQVQDLIDFNVIEDHKENIQALPSGRSAKALAALYSPPLTGAAAASQTQDLNSAVRQEYEKEVAQIEESDDPLDVYDRYVKWTLDAYPSAQATPQSQLLPLLERATRTFLSSNNYKNDPRYLKLWLHYIRLFSDSPRETFVFMARNGVGETLALYYDEFAAWLESAGRWTQAEEVYKLGLEKGATPAARLLRKFGEFERRKEAQPQDLAEPTSPVIPTVRPALAAKIDPFASSSSSTAQQSDSRPSANRKTKSSKMAIFSDEGVDGKDTLGLRDSRKGWDSIGSLATRKKENSHEPKAWVGETLKVGKTNTGVPKMQVFKSSTSSPRAYESSNHDSQRIINPKTGRPECVFVNLEAVYPDPNDPSLEYCFEELRAAHRGWLQRDWASEKRLQAELVEEKVAPGSPTQHKKQRGFQIFEDDSPLPSEQHVAKGSAFQPQPSSEQKEQRGLQIFADQAAQVAPQSCSSPKQKQQRGFEIFADGAAKQTPNQVSTDRVISSISKPSKVMALNDENDENAAPSQRDREIARRMRREERANRTRKIKVMDVQTVQKETQTIQLNMNSPTGAKIRKKKATAEPTMTINTREAMEEIYGIFNQPVKTTEESPDDSESESDSDDDYTTDGGESTQTGNVSSAPGSEYGDETRKEIMAAEATAEEGGKDDDDAKSDVTGWSDFSASKHAINREHENASAEAPKQARMQIFHDSPLEENSKEDEEEAPEQSQELVTPLEEEPKTRYIPLPPEDYEPVTTQFRNPAFAAQSRLSFMTPIVEKTESSLGLPTGRTEKDYFNAKTPSRKANNAVDSIPETDDGPWSSPFQDLVSESAGGKHKVLQPIRTKTTKGIVSFGAAVSKQKQPLGRALAGAAASEPPNKGPIIHDTQCNPMDPNIRQAILSQIRPPLSTYDGYHEDLDVESSRTAEIRKFAKSVGKAGRSSTNGEKTATTLSLPPMLRFNGTDNVYTVKRELGAGAFAPVYLVENSGVSNTRTSEDEEDTPAQMGVGTFSAMKRSSLEAIKMEDPPSAWEFYMIRQAHRRLGVSRAAESIVQAYEMHMFRDEGFLLEQFRDQGTLLDLVNVARAEGAGMDEQLAIFFSIELLRTVEALHAKGIIHGDLKGDNVLVRFENVADADWSARYTRDGSDGWAAKGVSLIDFGRGIDMKVFRNDVQFVADWQTTEADCAEMREMRPWTYQVDYHGLAGLVHSLLFGKYMQTVAERGGGLGQGATKTYRIRDTLKRYWQCDIWSELFALLLNPLAHAEQEETGRLPLVKGMKAVREKMESWLVANCEKGVGLKGLVRRMEASARDKKR